MNGEKLNVRIYTAGDTSSVFVNTEEKLSDALKRHPDVAQRVNVTLYRTRAGYGEGPGWSEEDFARYYDEMRDADIMVGYMFPLENIRSYAPRLRWIHIIGAGVEHLTPMSWLPGDIALTNNRGAHAPKTYEFALMTILMLGNHIPRLVSSQRDDRWDGHFVSVVKGQTIVIIGAGKQGSAVALAAKNLGLVTVGVDPDTHDRENFDRMVPPRRLHDVLPLADYVALTVPLTPSTERFFGDREFSLMKPDAGFFNICRGKVLKTENLIEALDTGQISGAVLDVFDEEPLPPDSLLWSAPNLVITPHMGCDDDKNYIPRTYDIVFDNIRRLLNEERLENLVDPKLGY
jgi:phosphoglycerate dehydrogenase-like enzyme